MKYVYTFLSILLFACNTPSTNDITMNQNVMYGLAEYYNQDTSIIKLKLSRLEGFDSVKDLSCSDINWTIFLLKHNLDVTSICNFNQPAIIYVGSSIGN